MLIFHEKTALPQTPAASVVRLSEFNYAKVTVYLIMTCYKEQLKKGQVWGEDGRERGMRVEAKREENEGETMFKLERCLNDRRLQAFCEALPSCMVSFLFFLPLTIFLIPSI